MTLSEKINRDLKKALKNKETERISTLRLLRNSIKQARIKKGKDKDFSDEEVIKVLQSEAKQRKESIQEFKKADRGDLAKAEEVELEIIQDYLPEQLTEEEIRKKVEEAVSELNAQSLQDMGQVMGKVMSEAQGRADGKKVKELVEEKLS